MQDVEPRTYVDVGFLPVQRRVWSSSVKEYSEQEYIRIDEPGRLGNDGRARAVLE
jgi:hypothetical protein